MKISKMAIMLFLLSPAALAGNHWHVMLPGGNMRFQGKIIAEACSLALSDRQMTVDMGQLSSNRFHAAGEYGDSVLMNPLMILVKIIKLRWIHILSYDQMVSRKINNQTTRCANSIFYTT
ncbi:fimbrial protein, partial [Escherichia coli]|uniref:fimbrial protein n=1 Tax=Escherichia coli TaxID=562 RepID=UPI00207B25CE